MKKGNIIGSLDLKNVHASQWTTCITMKDNDGNYNPRCFGYNLSGQLGLNSTTNMGDRPDTMGSNLDFPYLGYQAVVKKFATKYYHSCALLSNDQIKCYGSCLYGRCGYGNEVNVGDQNNPLGDSTPFVDLGTSTSVLDVDTGVTFTCVILNTNRVKCFGGVVFFGIGYGDSNIRGDGPNEMGDNLPFIDLGNFNAQTLSAGYSFVCAVSTGGDMKCWGCNTSGQLGYGDSNTRGNAPGQMGDNLPVLDFGSNLKVVSVSTGQYHTCAILDNQTARCWGSNYLGIIGAGAIAGLGYSVETAVNVISPLDLDGIPTKIVSSPDHNCALLSSGAVKCWGSGASGGLGYGDTNNRGDQSNEMGSNLPVVDIADGYTVTDISVGEQYSCVILDGAFAKCWGYGASGRLGYGNTNNIGDEPFEMGSNFTFINLDLPITTVAPTTSAPTKSPQATISPTISPSKTPSTINPTTSLPTKNPTQVPTRNPTQVPTGNPAQAPTVNPTTAIPSRSPSKSPSQVPTRKPSTLNPTKSPTKEPTTAPIPPQCIEYTNETSCKSATGTTCGKSCTFKFDQVKVKLQMGFRYVFIPDSGPAPQFNNVLQSSSKQIFNTTLKAMMQEKIPEISDILILSTSISQTLFSRTGTANYDVYFNEQDVGRQTVIDVFKAFESYREANLTEFKANLNAKLSAKNQLSTLSFVYDSNQNIIQDVSSNKGICGCSAATSLQLPSSIIYIGLMMFGYMFNMINPN